MSNWAIRHGRHFTLIDDTSSRSGPNAPRDFCRKETFISSSTHIQRTSSTQSQPPPAYGYSSPWGLLQPETPPAGCYPLARGCN
ncbi:hypothetical protein KCP77_03635 [Salmonella enterica subsp. enterica]|nr:hypothetical protein KCP77_03635 [Salmonella enterica subsp. enterica]